MLLYAAMEVFYSGSYLNVVFQIPCVSRIAASGVKQMKQGEGIIFIGDSQFRLWDDGQNRVRARRQISRLLAIP